MNNINEAFEKPPFPVKPGISLGYPLDQLLRCDCPLEIFDPQKDNSRYIRGIELPEGDDPGTGNIVICGHPGSGKSTLAMQFAVACVQGYNFEEYRNKQKNRIASAYISLEEEVERIKTKAGKFGWGEYFHKISQLHDVSPASDLDGLADILQSILTQPRKLIEDKKEEKIICPFHGPFSDGVYSNNYNEWKKGKACTCNHILSEEMARPCVLLPTLSPRPVSSANDPKAFFLERYVQLDRLLHGAKKLREKENPHIPSLRLVCIDSLNMFGLAPLSREELFRLFDLFRRYEMIGVFVVETSQETPFDSTMADVVISLHAEEDRSYFVRYLEIEKSRFYSHVYGKHLFKTIPIENEKKTGKEIFTGTGCVVYPSLHYLASRINSNEMGSGYFEFGIDGLQEILPQQGLKKGSVIVIEGPLGTCKTSLAMGFLAFGLASVVVPSLDTGTSEQPNAVPQTVSDSTTKTNSIQIKGSVVVNKIQKEEESVLLIHLHDRPIFSSTYNRLPKFHKDAEFLWQDLEPCNETINDVAVDYNYLQDVGRENKTTISLWKKKQNKDIGARFIEIDFKSGAVFPEEFVQIIRDIFRNHKKYLERKIAATGSDYLNVKIIKRVVFDDVSLIGLSYPFLRKSRTTEDQFLPVFIHIMRNLGVNLVITGTTGDSPEASDLVRRACSLADTVLSCRLYEIYGERHIAVQSEGLLAAHSEGVRLSREPVPALIRIKVKERGGVAAINSDSNEEILEVNPDYLEGLVGFQAGNIHRPGISLHLFEETERIHGEYNRSIETFLKSAFAVPFPRVQQQKWATTRQKREKTLALEKDMELAVERGIERAIDKEAPSVTISTFDSKMSESVHDSINVLKEKPFDRTVLVTLDEFWGATAPNNSTIQRMLCRLTPQDKPQDKPQDSKKGYYENIYNYNDYMRPYYANLLVLAYRKDIDTAAMPDKMRGSFGKWASWDALASYLESLPNATEKKHKILRRFWYDRSADETLSCGLMSALISGSKRKIELTGILHLNLKNSHPSQVTLLCPINIGHFSSCSQTKNAVKFASEVTTYFLDA